MVLLSKAAKITTPGDLLRWGSCFAENGLFILLEVEGNETKPAASVGKEILDLILTQFTNFKEHNLATIEELLSKIREQKNITTVIIGVLTGKILYLGSLGEGKVVIEREGKIGQILSGHETVSGRVNIGDKLMFYSHKLFDIMDSGIQNQILTLDEPEETVEMLATHLVEREELKGSAVLVVSICEEKVSQPLSGIVARLKEKSKSKVGGLLRKGKNIFAQNLSQPSWRTEETKSKRTFLTISILLIILLIMSIFFNINHTRQTKNQKMLAEKFSLVSQQYDEAVSLTDLNPVRARTLLSDSKLVLSPLLKEFPKGSSEYKAVSEWLNKVSEAEVTAYKIYKLTAVPLFFDLNLIKQGGIGSKIVGYREQKAILDTTNKVVYSLSTDTKQAGVIAGSDTVKEAVAITIHGDVIYILNSEGIVGIDIPSKTAKIVIRSDEKWGEIISLSAFGGNLYLLDRKNNAIWKYIATDFGFSARSSYLNPDVRADFREAGNIIIDGSVWVSGVNDILKFTRGLGEQFSFKGFSDTVQNLSIMTTGDLDKNIYILDKALSRIVVFNKEGDYQSQYQWDELKNADDIVSSEAEKKIFVLTGSKIYAIDLK